jgi:tripartite-type tricarboxylate transporter receptor subunit TctC
MKRQLRAVFALGLLILGLTIAGVTGARAETYPSKQVRIVVAYPAGGAADVIVRGLAYRLGAMWGQPIIIENRAGGGTQIAADVVARSAPDGYTLFATGMETFAISPFIYAKLSYDSVNDFVPISGLGYANQILVVPASSSLKSIPELIAKAEQDKGQLLYGTIGLGGSSHINMVLLETMAHIKLTPVHFRGGAPLLTDLLGDHVPMGFLSVTLVYQDMIAGKLRALGVGSKDRLAQLPDVPTISESGVPGFEAISWFGLFAPRETPHNVVLQINSDIQTIFADPEFRKQFLEPNFLGTIPGDSAQFAGYVQSEADKWSKVIKAANLKVE